uniref:Uncharacterized protein n=1 Tax=Anguilla anguilla TaxID=7936 RepID=A0A0E9RFG0_ANGAN
MLFLHCFYCAVTAYAQICSLCNCAVIWHMTWH